MSRELRNLRFNHSLQRKLELGMIQKRIPRKYKKLLKLRITNWKEWFDSRYRNIRYLKMGLYLDGCIITKRRLSYRFIETKSDLQKSWDSARKSTYTLRKYNLMNGYGDIYIGNNSRNIFIFHKDNLDRVKKYQGIGDFGHMLKRISELKDSNN